MGELLCPLPGAGLCGCCLPREAPGGATPVAAISTGNLESAPAVTPGLSVCRAWRLRAGPLICSARGRSVLAVLGPPGLCLSQGRPDPGLCPGALCSGACAVGFVLLAALPPRRRASAGAASYLLPGGALRTLQPFRELSRGGVWRALPGAQVLC